MGRSQFGRDASRRTGGGGTAGSGNVSQITSADGSVTISPAAGTGVVDLSVNDRAWDTSETVASAIGATWDGITVSGTATVTGVTAIATAAGFNSFTFAAPTVTAAGAVAITYSATVAIAGAPVVAGLATITNAYALWVQSGFTRLDGYVGIGLTQFASPAVPLQIEYNNTSAAFPGIILNSVAPGITGRAVIELRQQNNTVTKWWADTNGDAYVEAANSYFIKVDQNGAIKYAFGITEAGVVTVGPQTSATFNYPDGLQIQCQAGGNTAHLCMGRAVAANDAFSTANIGFFNGSDRIVHFQVFPDGALDAGQIIISTKVTGVPGLSDVLVVKSSGAVGIGTLTPQSTETFSKLTVEGTSATSVAFAVRNLHATGAATIVQSNGGIRWSQYIRTTDLAWFNGSDQVAILANGRWVAGYTFDITGGSVTTGIQVAGLTVNQGNVVTGRQTAATTGICSAIFGYNGTNYIAHIGFYANSANDAGYVSVFAKKTGVAVTEVMRINPAAAADETALLIERNLAGTFTLQRVSMNAVDTAGAGFRALRVPN